MKLSLLPLSRSALTFIPLITIPVVDLSRLGIGFGLEIAADTLLWSVDPSSHKSFGLNIAEAVVLSSRFSSLTLVAADCFVDCLEDLHILLKWPVRSQLWQTESQAGHFDCGCLLFPQFQQPFLLGLGFWL